MVSSLRQRLFLPVDKKGFTFIELLLVVSLFFVIVLAISTAIIQGVKVYYRYEVLSQDEGALFGLDVLTRDVKSYYPFSLIPVESEFPLFTFPILVNLNVNGPYVDEHVAQVTYEYDPEKKVVYRTVERLSYQTMPKMKKREVLFKNVDSFEWVLDVEEEEEMPRMLQIDLKYRNAFGQRALSKKIVVPLQIQFGSTAT